MLFKIHSHAMSRTAFDVGLGRVINMQFRMKSSAWNASIRVQIFAGNEHAYTDLCMVD